MEYMSGGELYKLLKIIKQCSEFETKFIVAQVVLAIEFLHNDQHLIYRDLKPENILLSANGYVKIADFGLSKHFQSVEEKAFTIAGTHEYLAPEILRKQGHNKNCDLWAIGIFCFELLHGKCPFEYDSNNPDKFMAYLIENKPKFRKSLQPTTIDFMQKLLVHDQSKRLGALSMDDLKQHPFFMEINFEEIKKQTVKSPLLKYLYNKIQPIKQVEKVIPITETPDSKGIVYPHVTNISYTES